MKNRITGFYVALLLLLGTPALNSQWPSTYVAPIDSLKAIKAANVELIQKQEKTLQVLDDLEKTSQEIKIRGKRT